MPNEIDFEVAARRLLLDRARQGLPSRIDDPALIAQLAALLPPATSNALPPYGSEADKRQIARRLSRNIRFRQQQEAAGIRG